MISPKEILSGMATGSCRCLACGSDVLCDFAELLRAHCRCVQFVPRFGIVIRLPVAAISCDATGLLCGIRLVTIHLVGHPSGHEQRIARYSSD